MAMDTMMAAGSSRGWKVMEEPNTFTLTTWAKTKPRMAPITPPSKPRNNPSPRNSARMEPSDAPRALRRPISRRRSETTAIMVVDTQIMVSKSTTSVTRNTRAVSFSSTDASERATRLTSRACTLSLLSVI